MEGHLLTDVFSMDKFLINGVGVRIKLWQQKNNFRLISTQKSKGFKVKITEAILKGCYVNVSPHLSEGF